MTIKEYFYNESTQLLYFYYNGTTAPPSGLEIEVVVNDTLVSLIGTSSDPVVGNTFQGITFRDAAHTYLEPHGVPSGNANFTVRNVKLQVEIGGCKGWVQFFAKERKM